jgi:uncharacterized membrane protein YqaE (UPF0057 family)
MKQIKAYSRILAACMLVLTLSSFGVLTAVVNPNTATHALATVSAPERGNYAWIEAPSKLPTMPSNQLGVENKMTMDAFMNLTPAQYKQMTGKKLGWFKSMELKMAQKQMKKHSSRAGDLPQWAYIVLSIFWLGWLAIGIRSDWKGNDWWICLLLYFLFYFPGLIYALVVMNKYY